MGNSASCENTLSHRSGNDRLKNRAAGVGPSAARPAKFCSAVHTGERRVGKRRWLCCIGAREPLRPSTAEAARWSVILYAIAGVTSAILVVVFIRAAFAERRRKEDELEREVRERRASLPSAYACAYVRRLIHSIPLQ